MGNRNAAQVEQIARIGHFDVSRKPAVDIDAKDARPVTDVLVAASAQTAFAAADPGIHGDIVADQVLCNVVALRDNAPCDFMAKDQREAALRRHVEPAATAEIEIAVLKMQIGMADTTVLDFYEQRVPSGRHEFGRGRLERFAGGDELFAPHYARGG